EMQNMHDWLDEGGKVFATHYHYVWFKDGPADFQKVATWATPLFNAAIGLGTYDIDATFPKGAVFSEWLSNLGATSAMNQITLAAVADSVATVTPPTQRWIYGPDGASTDVKYMSFLTPVGGAAPAADAGSEATGSYCG